MVDQACDWTYDSHDPVETDCGIDRTTIDVVNQEYSIGRGGRIDVIATFDHRKKYLIAECKQGTADKAAFDQLCGYFVNAKDRFGGAEVRGFLVAEDFIGIGEQDLVARKDLSLFAYKMGGHSFLFVHVLPEQLKDYQGAEGEVPFTPQESGLSCSRISTCAGSEVEGFATRPLHRFAELLSRLLDVSSWRETVASRGRVTNSKSSHVAVHYKGQYILHLWANAGALTSAAISQARTRKSGLRITTGKSGSIRSGKRSASVVTKLTRRCDPILAHLTGEEMRDCEVYVGAGNEGMEVLCKGLAVCAMTFEKRYGSPLCPA